MESIGFLRYNAPMYEWVHQADAVRSHKMSGFFKNHAFALALLSMTLVALPAYLSAMEGQFIDIEFLASLCGITGWGS